MIQQIKGFVPFGFRENTSEYSSKPSADEIARIKWLEYSVVNKTHDFLHEPEWFATEWEDYTGEDFPVMYFDEFPKELYGCQSAGRGRGLLPGFILTPLPMVDHKGEPIEYPEERLVEQFLQKGERVYILNDSLLKELTESNDKVPA